MATSPRHCASRRVLERYVLTAPRGRASAKRTGVPMYPGVKCHATNRYDGADAAIETDQATVKMPKRLLTNTDSVYG